MRHVYQVSKATHFFFYVGTACNFRKSGCGWYKGWIITVTDPWYNGWKFTNEEGPTLIERWIECAFLDLMTT